MMKTPIYQKFVRRVRSLWSPPQQRAVVAIPTDVARVIPGFDHARAFTCATCASNEEQSAASIRVRSREPRAEGASNYAPGVPSGDLNWLGLLEERGWRTSPHVVCPACQAGLSLQDFKDTRRAEASGLSLAAYREWREHYPQLTVDQYKKNRTR